MWYLEKMQFLNDHLNIRASKLNFHITEAEVHVDPEVGMDAVVTSESHDNDVTIQQEFESTNEILGGQYEIIVNGSLRLLCPPKRTAPASSSDSATDNEIPVAQGKRKKQKANVVCDNQFDSVIFKEFCNIIMNS